MGRSKDKAEVASQIAVLKSTGKKIAECKDSKDALVRVLKSAAEVLETATQPPQTEIPALNQLARSLISDRLIKSKDKEIRLLTCQCLANVLRLYAPEAPYSEDEQREVYAAFVDVFDRLKASKRPGFDRCTAILDTLASSNALVPILDFEEADTTLAVFRSLIGATNTDNSEAIEGTALEVLATLLEESDEVPEELLDLLLMNVTNAVKESDPARHRLVKGLLQRCEQPLQSQVQRFLVAVLMEGKSADSEIRDNYHDVIEQLYMICPAMLLPVIPNLEIELQVESHDKRLAAVHLIGKLIASPGSKLATDYRNLFDEFIRRFNDKKADIRVHMLQWASRYLSGTMHSLSVLPGGGDLRDAMFHRLQDFEDRVRSVAVREVCSMSCSCAVGDDEDAVSLRGEQLRNMAPRLRDKRAAVRIEAVKGLLAVYKTCAARIDVDSMKELAWIPCRLLRSLADAEVQSYVRERFDEGILPNKVSIEDKCTLWTHIISEANSHEKECLQRYFAMKARIRNSLSAYLSSRQSRRGAATAGSPGEREGDNVSKCMTALAGHFSDRDKAMECLTKLDNVKDGHVFRSLSTMLDLKKGASAIDSAQEDVIKRVGGRPGLPEFARDLTDRISCTAFSTDLIDEILGSTENLMEQGEYSDAASRASFLELISRSFPSLIEASLDGISHIVSNTDAVEEVLEPIISALSRLQPSSRQDPGLRAALIRHCETGTWSIAKHSTHALVAHAGTVAMSALYRKAVKSLQSITRDDVESGVAAFAVVGAIGQTMPELYASSESSIDAAFEKVLCWKAAKAKRFVWSKPSNICVIQMAAMRSSTRACLLTKRTVDEMKRARSRAVRLLGFLKDQLNPDTDNIIDEARLKAVAASLIIRLSRQHDPAIDADTLLSLALSLEDEQEECRDQIFSKLSKAVRTHTMSVKLASCLVYCGMDNDVKMLQTLSRVLHEWVEKRRKLLQAEQTNLLKSASNSTLRIYPEYVIPYAVFLMAHHPDFPASEDISAGAAVSSSKLEPFVRGIVQILQPLLSSTGGVEVAQTLPAIFKLLRMAKSAEDGLGPECTPNLYAAADIALMVVRDVARKQGWHIGQFPGAVPLPGVGFYKEITSEGATRGYLANPLVDGSHLPPGYEIPGTLLSPWKKRSAAASLVRSGSAKKSKSVEGKKKGKAKKQKALTATDERKPRERAMLGRASKKAILNMAEESELPGDSGMDSDDESAESMDFDGPSPLGTKSGNTTRRRILSSKATPPKLKGNLEQENFPGSPPIVAPPRRTRGR